MTGWDYPYWECPHGIKSSQQFIHSDGPGTLSGFTDDTLKTPCHPTLKTGAEDAS